MQTPQPQPSDARETALRDVTRALTGFPGGRALARVLEEAVAAAAGVSIRQARRRLRLAATGPGAVVRLPKTAEGTTYCLPRGGRPANAIAPVPAVAPWIAAVPLECRRDVALTVAALVAAGGEARWSDLARSVAALAGRPHAWGKASVEAAVAAAGRRNIGQRRDGPSLVDVAVFIAPGVEAEVPEAWAREPDFRLPADHAALELRLRRAIGAVAMTLTPGQAEVLRALAALGGTATAEDLYAHAYGQRHVAIAVVGTLRDAAARPAWVTSEGGRRYRLAAALWP